MDLGRKIGNRRVETHAGPSILSYFTEKTKCTNPSFRLLPSFRVSAVKDPVRGRGKGTISFFLPDQFEIACPFSGRSTTSRYIVYTGPTSAPKPASPGFKFSKLDDWPFREWNLLTNSEDGSTIQLLCGEISN